MTNQNQKNDRLMIFLHIPKTGGTTLTHIIHRQDSPEKNILYWAGYYGLLPEGVNALQPYLTNARTLSGHMYFGAHRYISRPCIYVTMLRNPLEQVTSWFYFRYKNPRFEQYHGSLTDWLADNTFRLEHSNVQTRFISGEAEPSISRAKENIERYFHTTGIVELFDDSIFLMKKEFDWENIEYTKRNVNPGRPLTTQLSNNVIEAIHINSPLDFELYNYAMERLQKQIAGLDPSSKQELARFKNFPRKIHEE